MNCPLPSAHNHRLRQPLNTPDSTGLGRQRRVNCLGWAPSAHLQRLPIARCMGRCTGLQTQLRENLLNHRLFQDRRNDLQLTAKIREVL